MRCPKCEGKLAIKDKVVTSNDEVLRKRVCEKCEHTLYTVEFEAIVNDGFMKEWHRNYRKKNDPRSYECDHYSTITERILDIGTNTTTEKEVGVCYKNKGNKRCNCGGNPKKCELKPSKK